MALKFKVDRARHIADAITKVFLSFQIAPKDYYLLTTIGRQSGIPRSNPVIVMVIGDRRWLVSPYGKVGWVFNAKASGKVTLTRKGKSETFGVRECSAQQAAPVLRKYVKEVTVTRPYFDVGVNSSEAAYIEEAPRHPVFELLPIEA